MKFLKSLLSVYSTSGYEDDVQRLFAEEMRKIPGTKELFEDNIKNVAFSLGSGKTKIMLSGHSDWIAYQVFSITDNGFLRISTIGGTDQRTLPGSEVVIIKEDGQKIPGIVGIKPVHVIEEDEDNVIPKSLLVDIGCSSKDEVISLGIELGNPVYHKINMIPEFGSEGKYIVGQGLDDRVGLYITAEVMRRITNPNVTVIGVANSQEEVGLRGACISAAKIQADISIDIDVCPSTEEELDIDKDKYGNTELGKGAVISYGYSKHPGICKRLKQIAKDKNIPYQVEVTSAGGTNTEVIQTRSSNCATALISIPNQNMHTQVEKCAWSDINSAIELLSAYINLGQPYL